jgi:hypothetical protein
LAATLPSTTSIILEKPLGLFERLAWLPLAIDG